MASPAAWPPAAPTTAPATAPTTAPTGPPTTAPATAPAPAPPADPIAVPTGCERGEPVMGAGFDAGSGSSIIVPTGPELFLVLLIVRTSCRSLSQAACLRAER